MAAQPVRMGAERGGPVRVQADVDADAPALGVLLVEDELALSAPSVTRTKRLPRR